MEMCQQSLNQNSNAAFNQASGLNQLGGMNFWPYGFDPTAQVCPTCHVCPTCGKKANA